MSINIIIVFNNRQPAGLDFLNAVTKRITNTDLFKGPWSFCFASDEGNWRCSQHSHHLEYSAQQHWKRNVAVRQVLGSAHLCVDVFWVRFTLYYSNVDLRLIAEMLSGCWGCEQLRKPVLLQRSYLDGSQTHQKGSLQFPNVTLSSSNTTA